MGEASARRFGAPCVACEPRCRPVLPGGSGGTGNYPTEAGVLRAVIFDADSVLAPIERDCDQAARTDLIDSVMSLFVAGIWVSVVSAGPRRQAETMVRQLLGDGLVETIVTIDDLPEPDTQLARGGELYRLALWEMGITAREGAGRHGPGSRPAFVGRRGTARGGR